jgi:hypothetical protein
MSVQALCPTSSRWLMFYVRATSTRPTFLAMLQSSSLPALSFVLFLSSPATSARLRRLRRCPLSTLTCLAALSAASVHIVPIERPSRQTRSQTSLPFCPLTSNPDRLASNPHCGASSVTAASFTPSVVKQIPLSTLTFIPPRPTFLAMLQSSSLPAISFVLFLSSPATSARLRRLRRCPLSTLTCLAAPSAAGVHFVSIERPSRQSRSQTYLPFCPLTLNPDRLAPKPHCGASSVTAASFTPSVAKRIRLSTLTFIPPRPTCFAMLQSSSLPAISFVLFLSTPATSARLCRLRRCPLSTLTCLAALSAAGVHFVPIERPSRQSRSQTSLPFCPPTSNPDRLALRCQFCDCHVLHAIYCQANPSQPLPLPHISNRIRSRFHPHSFAIQSPSTLFTIPSTPVVTHSSLRVSHHGSYSGQQSDAANSRIFRNPYPHPHNPVTTIFRRPPNHGTCHPPQKLHSTLCFISSSSTFYCPSSLSSFSSFPPLSSHMWLFYPRSRSFCLHDHVLSRVRSVLGCWLSSLTLALSSEANRCGRDYTGTRGRAVVKTVSCPAELRKEHY